LINPIFYFPYSGFYLFLYFVPPAYSVRRGGLRKPDTFAILSLLLLNKRFFMLYSTRNVKQKSFFKAQKDHDAYWHADCLFINTGKID